MALEDNARDLAVDAIIGGISHLGLHSGFPATSGNEIAGGTPAYARKAVTWAAATGTDTRSRAINETPTFDIENGDTVSSIGCWSASTSGTLRGGADVDDEPYTAQGTYQVTAFTVSVT